MCYDRNIMVHHSLDGNELLNISQAYTAMRKGWNQANNDICWKAKSF